MKMRKIIGIDSMIFVWGVRGAPTPGQEDKVKPAQDFIKWVESKEWGILLPTPMIAEILSPVPPEHHQNVMSLIDKRFLVAPFDLPASHKCAELLYKSYNEPELIKYRLDNAIPKQKMKYDCMIAAICIVRKIDTIYSEDDDIKKFADGQISVKPIPPLSLPGIQKPLFS